MTSEPGSFAYNTFKVRVPRIIDEIVTRNDFSADIRQAFQDLRTEITGGTIRGLIEPAPDQMFWNTVSQPWLGHSWLDVPWYWAETFFYRRVLEATGYFQPGPWQGVDPYAPQKESELQPDAAPRILRATLEALPTGLCQRFEMLLHASLWGNRTDLSYNVASTIGPTRQIDDERANLLVDDTARVWDKLGSTKGGRVVMITDNAGTELLMDLALVDCLLAARFVSQVTLHLKPQPFFVSDAMPKDVQASIMALRDSSGVLHILGDRLQHYLETGRLVLQTHWFYPTSLFYFQMPPDLYEDLKMFDLVFLKGDANHRRLLGDAHWPPASSFVSITAYYPTPFVSLRTLKSELITGLSEGLAERLSLQEPDWRVNGRRGVIQANLSLVAH
ncbi:MAG: damage-control phosphatase ARMT1 family protein [Chloroflexi bacterium]|nr:damage-control phosphatase ARMT1 family protein [Chloroflexota bacterium]